MYLEKLLNVAYLAEEVDRDQQVVLIPESTEPWATLPLVVDRGELDRVYIEHRAIEPDLEVMLQLLGSGCEAQYYRELAGQAVVREKYAQLQNEREESKAVSMNGDFEKDGMAPDVGPECEKTDVLQEFGETPNVKSDAGVSSETSSEDLTGFGTVGAGESDPALEQEDTQTSEPEHEEESSQNAKEEPAPKQEPDREELLQNYLSELHAFGEIKSEPAAWACNCVRYFAESLVPVYKEIAAETKFDVFLRCNAVTPEELATRFVSLDFSGSSEPAGLVPTDWNSMLTLLYRGYSDALKFCCYEQVDKAVALSALFADLIYGGE